MQKYCSTLKFTWKEFDTKLLDNFLKNVEKLITWRFEQVLEHFIMLTKLVNTV